MSDTNNPTVPSGDGAGDDATAPRARTRTRTRAAASSDAPASSAQTNTSKANPAKSDAASDDAPAAVKRTTRKRSTSKASTDDGAASKPAAKSTSRASGSRGGTKTAQDDAEVESKPATRTRKAPAKATSARKPAASRAKAPAADDTSVTDKGGAGDDAEVGSATKPVRQRSRPAPGTTRGGQQTNTSASDDEADAGSASSTRAPRTAKPAGSRSSKPTAKSGAKPGPQPGSRPGSKPGPKSGPDGGAESAAEAAADFIADDADDVASETDDDSADRTQLRRTRRGRRGGRNRNRSTRLVDGEAVVAESATDSAADTSIDDEAVVAVDVDEDTDSPIATSEVAARDDSASTRLQARARRGSEGPAGRGRKPSTARRGPLGGVSEEVRRVIAESPPRRMLVTVGSDRTQIAVLEERTLVEHYVTRKQDVSYVGNIYVGRVQNVLPGMEAAFVDVGKGRNGVLYAGEVNYDEADLDGEVPRIEEQLKSGQTVLVQVTKDPMGTKGARLTQHLSIAGRFCVLAPGEGMLGISRKLPDDERERLRVVLKAIRPEGFGLIVRTAAEGATREQLEADVTRLVRIWEQVDQRAKKSKPLDTVYEEPDLVIRVIRDIFGPEYTELIVDSELLATQIRDYLGDVSPELVDRVKVHPTEGEDAQNMFDAYEVTNQIRRALEKKVWLKSGGYLIVEKTEAMWVIDVNTGKFVGERNLEATVLKNNLEAADEIARQLRLRDMGGIIVIDFVDMLVPANRDEVLKRFKRELARDKTKSRVMEISKLGLVQMTRKNVSVGLQESFTTRCEVCEGRGAKIVERIV